MMTATGMTSLEPKLSVLDFVSQWKAWLGMTALLVVYYEKPAKFSEQPGLCTQLLVPVQ